MKYTGNIVSQKLITDYMIEQSKLGEPVMLFNKAQSDYTAASDQDFWHYKLSELVMPFNKAQSDYTSASDQDFYYYQLKCFTELLNNTKVSSNKYNDRSFLKNYAVLDYEQNWAVNIRPLALATERQCGDNPQLIRKYTSLLSVTGFLKCFPLIFDQDMILLDGYQRYHACRLLDIPFWYVRIDMQTNQNYGY